ncbi:MAG TPA: serine hydrolase domain-containing protein [Dehalococcoidia bacterium]|nr:serine hydrolase domain-containing protein [Dehalococcoidia bacterium]
MTDANDKVRAVLERLITSGEVGLQVAAYKDGKLVIDTWAGLAEKDAGKPVDGDTLFPSFSSAKGPTATCVHIAVERGQMYYDDPLAKYWREFAAKGKSAITVRHVLTHRAGLPDDPAAFDKDPLNYDGICAELAQTEPAYEPGSKTHYHGTTYGWLLARTLQFVDGRRIDRFMQDEVCRPLGLDSMFLGAPEDQEARVATLYDDQVAMGRLRYNRSEFRRSVSPAGGLITNARSLARMYAALANNGELDGARILPAGRIDKATVLQTDAIDGRFKTATRKALGYWLAGPGLTAAEGAGPNAFGHAGSGGSVGFADRERNYAFALTKNGLTSTQESQPTATIVEQAVEEALGLK